MGLCPVQFSCDSSVCRPDAEFGKDDASRDLRMIWSLDCSQSMRTQCHGRSRFDYAKDALLHLAEHMMAYGRESVAQNDGQTISLYVIAFSNGVQAKQEFIYQNQGSVWGFFSAHQTLQQFLNTLTPGGGTYYDAALEEVIRYCRTKRLGFDRLLHVFLSDGAPSPHHQASKSMGQILRFLHIQSVAVGFGQGSHQQALDHIDNMCGAVMVDDPMALTQSLLAAAFVAGLPEMALTTQDHLVNNDLSLTSSITPLILWDNLGDMAAASEDMYNTHDHNIVPLYPHTAPEHGAIWQDEPPMEVFTLSHAGLSQVETIPSFDMLYDRLDISDLLITAGYMDGQDIGAYVQVHTEDQTSTVYLNLQDGDGFVPVAHIYGLHAGGSLQVLVDNGLTVVSLVI